MKPKILLIGGGGHCASCIDVIEQNGQFDIAGIIDEATTSPLLGYPILGCDDDLKELRLQYNFALVSVGQIKTSAIRVKLFNHLKSLGFILPKILSPRAYVSKHASVGEGTIVMHDVVINARVTVGKNCIINTKALIEHDVHIEDNCHVSTGAILNGGACLKQGSFIGSNVVTKELVHTKEFDFIKAGTVFKGYKDA